MSVTAEHIRALMALGIDGEKLLAVVTIIDDASRLTSQETSRDARDAKSLSAARSKAYRDRKRVTRHDEPSHGAENPPLILTSFLTSSEEILSKKERKKESSGIRARDASAVPDDWPSDFGDVFWKAYPRKEEKISAMKKLANLRKSGIVTFADLMAGLKRYCSVEREPQFIKGPTVWLNKGCWADETQTGGGNGTRNFNPQRGSASSDFFAGMRGLAADIAGDHQPSGDATEEIPVGRVNIEH